MDKQIKLSKILKPCYFFCFALLLEVLNFAWLHFTITGHPSIAQLLPTYFIFDLAIWVLISALIFVLPRIGANIVFYLFLGFQIVINIANSALYKVFGDLLSLDMLVLGGEAMESMKLEFIDIYSIIVNIVFLAIIITTQVVVDRKVKKTFSISKANKNALLLLSFFSLWLLGLGSFCGQAGTLSLKDSQDPTSSSYLWQNMNIKNESYKRFGTYGFYLKGVADLIYKDDGYSAEKKAELEELLAEGQQEENTNAFLYGDNLIVIMLESYEWFAIDPYNTPTLWDIKTSSGVTFTNYHSRNKTNASEDIGILGSMPKDFSMDYLAKNNLLNTPYTLPNLFKAQGYSANFFHSFRKEFYHRDLVNANMGFDRVYTLEDSTLEDKSMAFNDWNLDSSVANTFIDQIIPTDTKFFSFYTTVSTHGTYDRSNKRFEEYYKEYDKNLPAYKEFLASQTDYIFPKSAKLQKIYRQYKCASMDSDRMVKLLLDNLEQKGLLDNTTIVLYADHDCFYEDVCFSLKGTGKMDFANTYSYNVPLMIYSKKLGHKEIDTFCNTFDLFPTICSLFGLPYNRALTQGYNIFSPEIEDSLFVSYLSGHFNAKMFSLNLIDIDYLCEVTLEEEERFKALGKAFYTKQKNIDLIYRYSLAK